MKIYNLIVVAFLFSNCNNETKTNLKTQIKAKESSVGKIEIKRGPFGSIFLEIMSYENFNNPNSINYLKKKTGC